MSGTGEVLGTVVHVETWPTGGPRRLIFREDGGLERRVRMEHVRAVRPEYVELKGPREGFHITRVSPSPPAPPGGTGW